jgi:hypothetical protein
LPGAVEAFLAPMAANATKTTVAATAKRLMIIESPLFMELAAHALSRMAKGL